MHFLCFRFDIGSKLPTIGIYAVFISLLAVTSGTLWQKKLSHNMSLPVSNMYQALGGFIFHLLAVLFFIEPYINFSLTFIVAMSHQILLVSFGAFTILMYLIKHNSASKTVSLFYLIPATSAFIAWIFLKRNAYHYRYNWLYYSFYWSISCYKREKIKILFSLSLGNNSTKLHGLWLTSN